MSDADIKTLEYGDSHVVIETGVGRENKIKGPAANDSQDMLA